MDRDETLGTRHSIRLHAFMISRFFFSLPSSSRATQLGATLFLEAWVFLRVSALLSSADSLETSRLWLPLVTFSENYEVLQAYGKTMSEFVGMKEYLSYVTVQDPAIATPQGYNEKSYVSIWGRSGRKQVDAGTFIEMMEAQKPDVIQILADGDTDLNSSKKRLTKAVDRTLSFAETCWALKEKSEVLKNTPVIASVEGGYSARERLRCIKSLKSYNFSAYVLDGFHTGGNAAETLSTEQTVLVLEEILPELPEASPRVFPGAVSPATVLELVSLGIDVFDTSFPFLVTERGGALIFPNSLEAKSSSSQLVETLPDNEETFCSNFLYFDDLRPLLEHCSCYACRKFSRSYIHHLLVTGELLGPILLQMHNLHHYLDFFRNIRKALKEDQLTTLKDILKNFLNERLKSV
nr:EOG090X08JG [Eulimnadia texana]